MQTVRYYQQGERDIRIPGYGDETQEEKPLWNQAEIMGMMGHDLRSSLSGLRGFLDLLSSTKLTEEQQEYLDAAGLCSDDLQNMLESIMDCAQADAGRAAVHREPTDLPALLQSTIDQFRPRAAEARVTIQLEIPKGFPEALPMDRAKTLQIMNNLLSNSIKFTRDGGIVVRARAFVSASGHGGAIELMVEDSGVGIPDDQLCRVFDPYVQCDRPASEFQPGSGLGLAIVEKLVAMLDGSVSIHSVAGTGTAVTVRLPNRTV